MTHKPKSNKPITLVSQLCQSESGEHEDEKKSLQSPVNKINILSEVHAIHSEFLAVRQLQRNYCKFLIRRSPVQVSLSVRTHDAESTRRQNATSTPDGKG